MSAAPASAAADPRDLLLDACRILDGEGLTAAFGHVSARTAGGTVLITPAGPGLVRDAAELLEVDDDANVVQGEAGALPGEVHLHLAAYRARPDLRSVCRCHPRTALAFSTLGRPLRPTTSYGAFLGPSVPVHATAGIARAAAGADAVVATLGEASAVLMRGFGAVTVGESVQEATIRALFLEWAAQAWMLAAPAGGGVVLTDEEVRPFGGGDVGRQQTLRAWRYYVRKHAGARRPDGGEER